jgi:hypothetical protein
LNCGRKSRIWQIRDHSRYNEVQKMRTGIAPLFTVRVSVRGALPRELAPACNTVELAMDIQAADKGIGGGAPQGRSYIAHPVVVTQGNTVAVVGRDYQAAVAGAPLETGVMWAVASNR